MTKLAQLLKEVIEGKVSYSLDDKEIKQVTQEFFNDVSNTLKEIRQRNGVIYGSSR